MAQALYLDSCALVKRFVTEKGSDVMEAVVGPSEFGGRLFVSEHVEGEVVAVLGKLLRKNVLRSRGFRRAMGEFYELYPKLFAVVPCTEDIAAEAVRILHQHPRAAISYLDAIHYLTARRVALELPDPNLTLVTSDGSLRNFATRFRMPVFNPETDPLARIRARS